MPIPGIDALLQPFIERQLERKDAEGRPFYVKLAEDLRAAQMIHAAIRPFFEEDLGRDEHIRDCDEEFVASIAVGVYRYAVAEALEHHLMRPLGNGIYLTPPRNEEARQLRMEAEEHLASSGGLAGMVHNAPPEAEVRPSESNSPERRSG